MRTRRKRGRSISNYIIITVIVLINFIGVSYASFSDDVSGKTTVNTGNINPYFRGYEIEKTNGNGNLTIANDGYNLSIVGDVEPGYEANIYYQVNNGGTLPAMLISDSESASGGLNIQSTPKAGVLDTTDYDFSKDKCSVLHITANDTGTLDINLTYSLWNQ